MGFWEKKLILTVLLLLSILKLPVSFNLLLLMLKIKLLRGIMPRPRKLKLTGFLMPLMLTLMMLSPFLHLKGYVLVMRQPLFLMCVIFCLHFFPPNKFVPTLDIYDFLPIVGRNSFQIGSNHLLSLRNL